MFHRFSPFNHLLCPLFCRHLVAPKYPLLLLLLFFLFPSFAIAEVKEIVAEGSYNMGDGETPTVAESRALLQAKRVAIEQAGTYIESYSKVKNFQLTQDEIQVLASGVMEVTILDKKRTVVEDGIRFWVKINAKVSTDKMQEMVRKVKEKSVVHDYKLLQQDYEKLAKELELLKKQLREPKSDAEKRAVEVKISDSERRFRANEWFEKGRRLLFNEKYDEAFEAFTNSINIDPGNAQAYVGRGATYGKKSQDDMALKDLNKAISINPNDAWAYLNRGALYNLNGQYDSAIEDLNRAIAIDPFFVRAYASRGNSNAQKGQYEKAFNDFDKAIAIDPNDPLAYGFRGLVHAGMGQHDKAISDLEKSCDLGAEIACRELKKYSGTPPNSVYVEKDAEACTNRGIEYYKKKQFDKAIEEFTKTVDLKLNSAAPYYNRGCAYLGDGQHQKAIEDFSIAVKINSKYANAYFNRGIAYKNEGQMDKAKADFKRACDLGEKDGCKKIKMEGK